MDTIEITDIESNVRIFNTETRIDDLYDIQKYKYSPEEDGNRVIVMKNNEKNVITIKAISGDGRSCNIDVEGNRINKNNYKPFTEYRTIEVDGAYHSIGDRNVIKIVDMLAERYFIKE